MYPVGNPCLIQTQGRRRAFWTTQPRACGGYELCGEECDRPGLQYDDSNPAGRTIVHTDWLISLVLNILNTKARTDLKCASPVAIFGHWSESYRKDGLYVGSQLWNAASKAYVRRGDEVNAVQAAIQADMAKLVALEVVSSVTVVATYVARGKIAVVITLIIAQNKHVLNLAGAFVQGAWAWQFPT